MWQSLLLWTVRLPLKVERFVPVIYGKLYFFKIAYSFWENVWVEVLHGMKRDSENMSVINDQVCHN